MSVNKEGISTESIVITTAQYRYDPYGNLTQGTVGQDRAYTYNAQHYIPQTGLQYLRARHYDASTGNFTSKDTYLGSQTNLVTQNRYTYANNNPVSYQDPSEHAGIFTKLTDAGGKVSTTKVKSYTSVGSSSNQVKTSTTKFISAVVNPNPEVAGRTKAVLSKTVPANSQNTVAKSTSVAAQMVSQATSSVTPVATATTKPTYGATSGATGTAAYAASSATAVSYQTVAAITSPTVSRYNRSKVSLHGTKLSTSIIEDKSVPLSSRNINVAQAQQSLGTFWQSSYYQWTPQGNQAFDSQSMSSLFYQNSLKSNTVKKDSAIGASEATALNSIQKEQRKKELEKQESSVGKFIEKEDTAESSKKNGFWSSVLDGVQTALDVVGLVPGLGELADGANAVIYTARGDYLNAALSLTACIPFAGWAATGGKFVNKAVGVINKADDIYDTAKTVGKFIAGKVDDIFDTANKAKKYIAGKADDIADIVQDAEKISKGGVKTDFYVTPSGDAVPATGYRYMSSGNATDALTNGKQYTTYIGFEKYDSAAAAREAFQVAPAWSDCKVRGTFDTLQVIDDMYVPTTLGNTTKISEPFTISYPQYGKGGIQQFRVDKVVEFNNVKIIGD